MLRATTACTFSTSQLPKVVRTWCALHILTWKCASRHNACNFSSLICWLRTRRFSEPTFRPSGATNHWKNTVFRDFPTFSRICIFFLLTLSLLLFSLLIFLFSLPLPYSAFHALTGRRFCSNIILQSCVSFCAAAVWQLVRDSSTPIAVLAQNCISRKFHGGIVEQHPDFLILTLQHPLTARVDLGEKNQAALGEFRWLGMLET